MLQRASCAATTCGDVGDLTGQGAAPEVHPRWSHLGLSGLAASTEHQQTGVTPASRWARPCFSSALSSCYMYISTVCPLCILWLQPRTIQAAAGQSTPRESHSTGGELLCSLAWQVPFPFDRHKACNIGCRFFLLVCKTQVQITCLHGWKSEALNLGHSDALVHCVLW